MAVSVTSWTAASAPPVWPAARAGPLAIPGQRAAPRPGAVPARFQFRFSACGEYGSVRTRCDVPPTTGGHCGRGRSTDAAPDPAAGALVRDRGPDLAVFCKAWRVRNTGGRFAKDQFTLDFATGQLTCPAGMSMPFEPGKTVRFPKATCAACPLRQRCTTSSTGRSVSIHPDEALLTELRQRQQTPEGREELRERVQVEHALAHVGHWQGRRARYLGTRKNLFDLRRVAVVHNLHIIARQTVTGGYQLAA
jgi:Transposase DDE domain